MGNTLTGSGSPESGPPSLSSRDEVAGEGNRLPTRTQNTSALWRGLGVVLQSEDMSYPSGLSIRERDYRYTHVDSAFSLSH